MVKSISVSGFACEKCGLFLTGKYAEEKIRVHEREPIKRVNSLNGLLVKRSINTPQRLVPVYTVILDSGRVDAGHNALYTTQDYLRGPKTAYNRRETLHPLAVKSLTLLLGATSDDLKAEGSPAHGVGGIFATVLYYCHSENTYPAYGGWNPGEFERVAETLKEKHPKFYKGIHFKRVVPSASRIIHPKRRKSK